VLSDSSVDLVLSDSSVDFGVKRFLSGYCTGHKIMGLWPDFYLVLRKMTLSHQYICENNNRLFLFCSDSHYK